MVRHTVGTCTNRDERVAAPLRKLRAEASANKYLQVDRYCGYLQQVPTNIYNEEMVAERRAKPTHSYHGQAQHKRTERIETI